MTKSLSFTEDELFILLRCVTSHLVATPLLPDEAKITDSLHKKILDFLLGKL